MKRLPLLLCIFLAFCVASGCAHNPKDEKTARQLADEGMKEFQDKDYKKSIDAFEQLRDWYPFSKYTILADLKIADAYFNMKKYQEAVSAYETFERLHPRNEAVPSVIYRIGVCHYNQLDTIDRDQTPAKKAIEAFTRLQNQFPESEYAEKAETPLQECRKSLADHELYVGRFYFKSKHYEAALARFQTVVEQYPEVGDVATARDYIKQCNQAMNEQQAAGDAALAPEPEVEQNTGTE
ncbi:MAG: outer membrane protein assembly factor BamD [Thermodesulfobacteriota bacterium]|nr:outer membrane protein assembly factor BamD [Thermodesulfobacteriota bacterium]